MQQRTRIKICGITRLDDARHAVQAGADALGFVFYPASPRAISAEQAQAIISKLPVFISMVALFVDPDKDFVKAVISQTAIDTLQFHGNEDEMFCQQFQMPYLKVIKVQAETNLADEFLKFPSAKGFLLDTYDKAYVGGTGKTFDWRKVPKQTKQAIILAGGLNADNVQHAMMMTSVYAVDVSSGVESEPGKKSARKIYGFVKQVRETDLNKGK